MRQPIMLSYFFPTLCSFGSHNLFYEKASLFQDFVIPALDQETYGEFLHFGPGLGVFTLERFSCSEDNSWKASPFQDFFIPALDQETFGEFLELGPGLGVFTLERFSCTEEDSRVSIPWDQMKGRPIPQTHQEFVDSKQRLRAALRNLRTVEDVPSNDVYRRYRITDLLEIRVKTGRKVEIPEIKIEVKDSPVLPRRRNRRKVKVEKCMYNDDDSSESWTECIKPPRKPRRPVNPRKIANLKEIRERIT